MDLTKGTGEWASWWAVVNPDKRVVDYLRLSVNTMYRQFDGDTRTWYVHDKYVSLIRPFVSKAVKPAEDDLWALLHLRPGAPQSILKAAWKVMAAELHPDRGGDAEQFVRVKNAYEKLLSKG